MRVSPARLPPAAALGRHDLKLKDGAEGLGMLSYRVLSLLCESERLRLIVIIWRKPDQVNILNDSAFL